MEASASFSRIAYQAAVTAVWLVGAFYLPLLGTLLFSGAVEIEPSLRALILLGSAGMAVTSLFSFWWGAQPGHWVRAANVVLFASFVLLMHAAYSQPETDVAVHARTWVIGLAIVMLNLNFARRFRQEYRAHGRVDYFDRYFR